MQETIRLFKAVPVATKTRKAINAEILKKTIPHGFIFTDIVMGSYPDDQLEHLYAQARDTLGLDAEQMNASFHTSWQKIQGTPLEQLIVEQLVHYFTTYGFEALGIYSEDSVYVPVEQLDIPALSPEPLHLAVVNGLSTAQIKDKVLQLLHSGIALKEQTLQDACVVGAYVHLTVEEIQSIRNKEARAVLFEYLDVVPPHPTEFLRYVVAVTTGRTLLIKNEKLIESIKEAKGLRPVKAFQRYEHDHGLERLAEIFYRFKPLFLAFKVHPLLKPKINKIRKLAEKHHKPMPKDFLNEVTANIKQHVDIDLGQYLERASVFRKIQLAYALKFRTTDSENIIYRVRNGRSYLTEFAWPLTGRKPPNSCCKCWLPLPKTWQRMWRAKRCSYQAMLNTLSHRQRSNSQVTIHPAQRLP